MEADAAPIVHAGQLYFGGDLTHAGSTVSCSIARCLETITAVHLSGFTARVVTAGGRPRVELARDGVDDRGRAVAPGVHLLRALARPRASCAAASVLRGGE